MLEEINQYLHLNEVMQKDKKIILLLKKIQRLMIQKKMIFLIMDVKVIFLQLLKLPDGTVKVLVEGNKRVKILILKMKKNL